MERPISRTVGDLLDEMAEKFPKNDVIIFKNVRYTYAELKEKADQVASSLIGMGLRHGDKVGMFVNSGVDFLTIAFGILKAGGVLVPFSTWYRTKEASYALKHCEIKVLFTCDQLLGFSFSNMIREIVPELDKKRPGEGFYPGYPYLDHVVAIEKGFPGAHTWEDFLAFGLDVSQERLKATQRSVEPEELAMILLTSGTTAHPKAVQMIHHIVIENPFNIGEGMGMTPKDRYLINTPMFYAMFLSNAMGVIMTHGASMVVQDVFEPGEALRLIEEEKCTVTVSFYNAFAAMLNHPDFTKRDHSSMRTGGTIASIDELREIGRKFIPQIIRGYGLTESYGFCCMTDVRQPLEERIGSLGKILPGFEYKIVNMETGEKVQPREQGELCIKGYTTPGYFKDPENNQQAFDKEGFFHTGDLMWEDEKGNLEFITRAKEMIKTSGINVAPASIEAYLMTNPKVKVINVIGLPDKLKDQVIAAVIELKEGAEATQEEIINYCKGKIAGYSIPKVIYFIKGNEWPLTVTGKVQKNVLKEMLISKMKEKA
jgi:fatty-acyl-CoA synthase